MERDLENNSTMLIEQLMPLCGFAFGYDERSVAWLDGYINRIRASQPMDDNERWKLANVFGSYLGTAIVRC